jgi:tetratricopeptide (TPR) repeat protein
VLAGGRDEDPPDRKRMREAGRLYLDAFERSRASCGKQRGGACEAPDEQLFNASAAFSRAGDLTQAMRALELLLDLPDTLARPDLVTRAAFQGGMRLASIADFEGAMRYFERASRHPSKESAARDALDNLVFLRMALGDTEGAQRAADDMTKYYAARTDISRIDVAMGKHLAEAGDHGGAVKWLERVMRRIDQSKSRDDRIEAHATLARSLGALGRGEKARKEWRVVKGLSESPSGGGEGSAGAVATTLRARGDAMVALARPVIEEAFSFKIEKGDVAGMKEKRAKVERAEEKLLEVLRMPLPPPGAVVDAGAALGANTRRARRRRRSTVLRAGEGGAPQVRRAVEQAPAHLGGRAGLHTLVGETLPGRTQAAHRAPAHAPLGALDVAAAAADPRVSVTPRRRATTEAGAATRRRAR